jgi:hypothetical protein
MRRELKPPPTCPAVTLERVVDDRVIGSIQLRATRTSRGRTMQIDYAMRRLMRDYPDATRWEVRP